MRESKRLDDQGQPDSPEPQGSEPADRLEAAVGSDFDNDLPLSEVVDEAAPTEAEESTDAGESEGTVETADTANVDHEPANAYTSEEQKAAEDRMASYVSALADSNAQVEQSQQETAQATTDYSELQSFADRRAAHDRQEIESLRTQVAALQHTVSNPQPQAQAQQPAANNGSGYYDDDLYDNAQATPTASPTVQPHSDPAIAAELKVLRERVAAQEVAKQQDTQAQQNAAVRQAAFALRDQLVTQEHMTTQEAETAVVLRHQGNVDAYADMLSTARSRRVRSRIATRQDAQQAEEAVSSGSRSTGRTRTVSDTLDNVAPLGEEDFAGLSKPQQDSLRQAKWAEVTGFSD
jgi:hypothetical protein